MYQVVFDTNKHKVMFHYFYCDAYDYNSSAYGLGVYDIRPMTDSTALAGIGSQWNRMIPVGL